MWHKVDKTTPPTGEIVRVMWIGGVEGYGLYRNHIWYQPTEHARLANTPTHWKRMGT